jgi:hypothetical protein
MPITFTALQMRREIRLVGIEKEMSVIPFILSARYPALPSTQLSKYSGNIWNIWLVSELGFATLQAS